MQTEYTYDGLPSCAYQFTGKERDTESGLDYFGARFDSSSLGRFMTTDPIAGQVSNPQSLNLYSYVRNNPLTLIDPTGMIVIWSDSDKKCKEGETVCRTNAQRAYEDRLKQLRESKDKKEHAQGDKLTRDYERLQGSNAIFEVTKDRSSGSSSNNTGDITYDGNNHFSINLSGNYMYGLSYNQRITHEFEHGRQVLDGELSFQLMNGHWQPFARDLTDEAKGFAAGFDMEGAVPNSSLYKLQQQLTLGGISSGAKYLGEHFAAYKGLPMQLNVPTQPPPNVYVVPQ